MEKKQTVRVWISIIIALLVIAIIMLTLPRRVYAPRGILLPAKIKYEPISSTNVIFYASAPTDYQTLGLIRITRHYTATNNEEAEQEILNLAKQFAAQAGANGIIVRFFAHTTPGTVSAAQAVYSFWGIAIRTRFTPQALLPSLSAYSYRKEGRYL